MGNEATEKEDSVRSEKEGVRRRQRCRGKEGGRRESEGNSKKEETRSRTLGGQVKVQPNYVYEQG